MKRAYMKPKAKMVNFQYTERVVASGSPGRYNSGAGYTVCQMNAITCTYFYDTNIYNCKNNPPENPGLPDPTI